MPARLVHVGPIAVRMREADRRECVAMGRNPRQALREGLQSSTICFTALVDARPEAMFGLVVYSALGGAGIPWMLGTDAIYDHPRQMLATGPRLLSLMLDSTPSLENVVAVENERAIRMLRRWGFSIGENLQVFGGVDFVTFKMELS